MDKQCAAELDRAVLEHEGEPITVIEYRREKGGWVPFSVFTESDGYNFEYSKKSNRLFYHNSNSGYSPDSEKPFEIDKFCNPNIKRPSGAIWANQDVVLVNREKTRLDKAALRTMGYLLLKNPAELKHLNGGQSQVNPFLPDDAYDNNAVYCGVCDDWMVDYNLCRHVFWDREIGVHAGPGADECNEISEYEKHILFFLSRMEKSVLQDLLKLLRRGTARWRFTGELLGPESLELMGTTFGKKQIYHYDVIAGMHDKLKTEEDENLFVMGGQWVMSLGGKRMKEIPIVIGWIEKLLAEIEVAGESACLGRDEKRHP